MFSRILSNLFSKHKTKILIALGVAVVIVVIAAVAKSQKPMASSQQPSAEPVKEVANE